MNLPEFRVYAVGEDMPHPDRLKAELWRERFVESENLKILTRVGP
jgi:hypothetical protein